MPIPEFYRFLRPALQLHQAGEVVPLAKVVEAMIGEFCITDQEQQQLLPSGRKTKVKDRVHWALTYLRQAQLLKSEGRGHNRITGRGKQYLLTCPTLIRPSDLMVFPEFAAFQKKQNVSSSGTTNPDPSMVSGTVPTGNQPTAEEAKVTPEEDIDAAYLLLKEALAQEVLERVKSMPPMFFERLIVKLMLRLGYGGGTENAGQTLGQSGDGGVDGVIHEDKLGLDKIYLQAKRWVGNSVGSPEVQAFVGALVGKGATKGVFITTSTFTGSAKEYAKNNHHAFKISLVDGTELARLMIDYDLGVSLVQRYEVKRIDSDFFADE